MDNECLKCWFGHSLRLVLDTLSKLFQLWTEARKYSPSISLSEAYFKTSTLTTFRDSRYLPSCSEELKEKLRMVVMGQVTTEEAAKLARYGVLKADGSWTSDLANRFYFSELFHSHDKHWSQFDTNSIPAPLDLLTKGLQEMEWHLIRSSAESSQSGFPIENIWQSVFYTAIGHFLPASVTFCKEEVQGSQDRVDFVLRNGTTRAIEFLIKSDRIVIHHERFENGAYKHLNSSYIVVDIAPWDKKPALHDTADSERLNVARSFFAKTNDKSRWKDHAVFLVENDCMSGILYRFNEATDRVEETARSPPNRSNVATNVVEETAMLDSMDIS